MMKYRVIKVFIPVVFLLCSLRAEGQFNHALSLSATVDLSAGRKALSYDNASYGISVDVSFLGKHRLQALFEGSVKSFFGDKIYYIPDVGRKNKSPEIYSLFGGPQYFLSKRIAIAATAGPAWHAIHTKGFSMNAGYQLSAAGFWGNHRRLVTEIFFTEIPKRVVNIEYFGLALGYRFL